MEQKRRPFQGVLNILSFNRHYYVFGSMALAILFATRFFINWPTLIFWIVIVAFLYGLVMPLVVSAYVYDISGYYKFEWLKEVLYGKENAEVIVNINAGFDETSFIIANIFPLADVRVFDFYYSSPQTEPAIKRAPRVSLIFPKKQQIASHSNPD